MRVCVALFLIVFIGALGSPTVRTNITDCC